MRNKARQALGGLLLGGLFVSPAVLGDDELFAISAIPQEGRIVNAAFADFDGDGKQDLMVASLSGIPPEEMRVMRVYLQNAEGSYSAAPSHQIRIPQGSAVYDIADLKDTPGDELILLRADGATVLSIASTDVVEWNITLEGPSTVAAADDERGFDRTQLFYDTAPQPLLLLPQIGAVSVLSLDGEVLGQIDVGGRANYYVARRSSIISVESDLQLYLDTPKLSIGDVNGDGLADIVAATRHEIRVFHAGADGRFDTEPSFAHALNLISQRDHSRGSGSVVTIAHDADSDGSLDLLVTHVEGTFSDTVTTTYFYRNQDGQWDLENPDDKFVSNGTFSSDMLLDVDGDGVSELARIQLKFSVLEVVEVLLTRKIDSVVAVHRLQPDGHFEQKPSASKKFSIGISFDTFRPNGFMPQGNIDMNADGLMDVVTSANGKGIEIYLSSPGEPLSGKKFRQDMTSTGRVQFEDFDGDGLLDFVLYDSQSFDTSLQIGRNLGVLPGLTE